MRKNTALSITCLLMAAFLTGCGKVQEMKGFVSQQAQNASIEAVNPASDEKTQDADDQNKDAAQDGHDGFISLQEGQDYVELCSSITEDSVIARMYHAEPLTVYDIQGDWAMVSYNNLKGYVPLEYISFSKPAEMITMEEAPPVTEPPATEPPATAPPATEPPATAPQITNNINLFLKDRDGFEYTNPVTLSNYVEDNRNAWCSTTSAYIYAKPDSSSGKREANMLYYGDSLTVLGSSGSYYYIATDSGSGYDLHGYVKQSYISFGQSPAPAEPGNSASYGRVNVGSANVRSSPDKSTDSNVMFVLYKGAEFSVISYDGYWYKINYNGTICYISHKMVEVW